MNTNCIDTASHSAAQWAAPELVHLSTADVANGGEDDGDVEATSEGSPTWIYAPVASPS